MVVTLALKCTNVVNDPQVWWLHDRSAVTDRKGSITQLVIASLFLCRL